MPDYASSREFERFATRIDAKIDRMERNQNEFFNNQSLINADVSSMKKKSGIVTSAIIALMVGTVWSKVTEQPVIKPQEELKVKTVKEKDPK